MIKHKYKNCLNLPFFKREGYQYIEVDETQPPSHKYTLLSIAKINTNGFDLYNNYFLSPYRKEYLEKGTGKIQLKPYHVSRLFYTFVKIYAIKHLIHPDKRMTMLINTFLRNLFEDIFEERPEEKRGEINYQEKRVIRDKRKEEMNRLRQHFKPIISEFFQKEQKFIMESTYEKQVEHVNQLIKLEIEFIQAQLDSKYQQIIKSQVLPIFPSLKIAKRYIKQNFQKIDGIDSFKPSSKSNVISSFMSVNRPYLKIKVPCLFDTLIPNQMEEYNTMILPRYSDELEPIITKLIDYVPRIHKIESSKDKLSLIILQKMKQLVSFFRMYKRNTSRVYPTTNLKDIYYDQKSMKIVVSYHPLIYDALGIKDSSKSVELRIATEPTPSFDFQKCHLELDETIMCKLKKKYYCPKVSKEDQLNKIDENNEDQVARLQENIHVWRTINKLYFMSRNANMANDLYEMYYCKITGQQKDSTSKAFRLKSYKEVTKRIYEDIGVNPEMLMQLIPQLSLQAFRVKQHHYYQHTTKQEQLAQLEHIICLRELTSPLQKFHYTISQLGNFFQQDDDSLFQTLKLTSFKSQFYYRFQIIKQMFLLFDFKIIFKRMINVKKYLIMYFVSIMERAYYLTTVRRLQLRKINTREEIENELEREYRNVYFNSQFQRRRNGLELSKAKIQDYMGRSDRNSEFLQKNGHYYEELLVVHHDMKMVAFQEDVCRMLERNQSKDLQADIATLMQTQEIQMDQQEKQPFTTLFGLKLNEDRNNSINSLKSTLQTRISNRIKDMHQKASSIIKKLTEKDVEPHVNSTQAFHKTVDFTSKAAEQVCLFYNYKLLTLLRMYVASNKTTWRKYERMYNNALIGGKKITLSSPVQEIKSLEKDELMMLVRKMKIILRNISDSK